MLDGYVYIMRSQQTSIMKIGMANDPFCRMKSIQIGHPEPLFMWATIESDSKKYLENQLHKLFRHDWIRGEWFRFTDSTFETFTDYCNTNNLQIEWHDFCWHQGLMCRLHGFRIIAPNFLHVFLGKGDCCDYRGCIDLAKQILPHVEIIQTFSGPRVDTRYLLSKGEWIANLMKEQAHV